MRARVEFYRQEFATGPDVLLLFPHEKNSFGLTLSYGRLYSEQFSRAAARLVYGPRWISDLELADYKKIKAAHAADLNFSLMAVASKYLADNLRPS
jgi:hypothetical protein